jgi:hypothetical protein
MGQKMAINDSRSYAESVFAVSPFAKRCSEVASGQQQRSLHVIIVLNLMSWYESSRLSSTY